MTQSPARFRFSQIYAEQVEPLLVQVFEICKEHRIPLQIIVQLSGPEDDRDAFREARVAGVDDSISEKFLAQLIAWDEDLVEPLLMAGTLINAINTDKTTESGILADGRV